MNPDIWRELIEKEPFEQETIIFVLSVVQREQGAHLPHQGGELLVGGQGETHAIMLPLEGVEVLELGEAFLE